jgi:hypothetical protein
MTEKNPKAELYDLDKIMSKKGIMDKIIEYFLNSSDKSSFS